MLERILHHKREELANRRRAVPLAAVRHRAEAAPPPRDLLAGLRGPDVALIAEIKRASPSRGPLAIDLRPSALASLYERGGAAAVSVLTDEHFFAGSLEDLVEARAAVSVPILRKDFVLDEYQIYEARAAGADAVLLIAAALPGDALPRLLSCAHELGLQCLVEAHDEGEVARALASGAQIVGVNNRDLRTFKVDLATTERLGPNVPGELALVGESGIHTRADVVRLARAGVDAVLVGEALVKAEDVAAAVQDLCSVPRRGRPTLTGGGAVCR